MTAPNCVLVVSTWGASEVTSTTSCVAPTCKIELSVTTWLTSTSYAGLDIFLKTSELVFDSITAGHNFNEIVISISIRSECCDWRQ